MQTEVTVRRIHELMAGLLNRTVNVGNEEETEQEVSEFVAAVAELRALLYSQMAELGKSSGTSLYAVEEANIHRLINRISNSSCSCFVVIGNTCCDKETLLVYWAR